MLAFESGFGDLSYFNRRFRRRYGRSPSEVKRTAQSMPPLESRPADRPLG